MRVLEIVKYIDAQPSMAKYRDVLVYCCNNGLYGEFRRLGCGVKYLMDEHNEEIYQERAVLVIEQSEKARLRVQVEGFDSYQRQYGPFHDMIRSDQGGTNGK